MTSNWAYNLDMLAQNGVLDFDAPAFVSGQAPRYVGSPSLPPSPYVGQVPPAPALKQPNTDEFKPQKQELPKVEKKNKDFIQNPSWKKWLFGAVAIGALAVCAFKAKSAYNWIKTKLSNNNFSWSKVGDFFKDAGAKIADFFKKGWNKLTGLFKKKP